MEEEAVLGGGRRRDAARRPLRRLRRLPEPHGGDEEEQEVLGVPVALQRRRARVPARGVHEGGRRAELEAGVPGQRRRRGGGGEPACRLGHAAGELARGRWCPARRHGHPRAKLCMVP